MIRRQTDAQQQNDMQAPAVPAIGLSTYECGTDAQIKTDKAPQNTWSLHLESEKSAWEIPGN